MNGCLINSWTDLMESWSRKWIKAKDMLDPSKRQGCRGRVQEQRKKKLEAKINGEDQTLAKASECSRGLTWVVTLGLWQDLDRLGIGGELAKECGSRRKERPLDRITCGSLPFEEHPELPVGRARVFTRSVKNALEGIAIERRDEVDTPAGEFSVMPYDDVVKAILDMEAAHTNGQASMQVDGNQASTSSHHSQAHEGEGSSKKDEEIEYMKLCNELDNVSMKPNEDLVELALRVDDLVKKINARGLWKIEKPEALKRFLNGLPKEKYGEFVEFDDYDLANDSIQEIIVVITRRLAQARLSEAFQDITSEDDEDEKKTPVFFCDDAYSSGCEESPTPLDQVKSDTMIIPSPYIEYYEEKEPWMCESPYYHLLHDFEDFHKEQGESMLDALLRLRVLVAKISSFKEKRRD
ncbi:hypothetical protein EJB05_26874, partial [Eragrostis curvula]